MRLEELLIPLGVELDDNATEKVRKLTGAMMDLAKMATAVAVGMAAVATAVTAATLASAKATEDIGRTATMLGIAVDELDAWNTAANFATGRTEGMAQEFAQFSRVIFETSRGFENLGTRGFAWLYEFGFKGVRERNGQLKDTRQVLLEVAEALQKVDEPARKFAIAERLGLQGILPLLNKGRAGIEELLGEVTALGVATQEDAQAARELMFSWRSLLQIFKDSIRLMATVIGPEIRSAIQGMTDWIKANRELIRQRLTAFFTALGKLVYIFWRILYRVARTVDELVSGTIGWSKALVLVVGALTALVLLLSSAALATGVLALAQLPIIFAKLLPLLGTTAAGFALLTAEILAVIVVAAAVALVLEDLWTSMEGGRSVIDLLISKDIPLLSRALELMNAQFRFTLHLVEAIARILYGGFSLDNIKGALKEFSANAEKDLAPIVARYSVDPGNVQKQAGGFVEGMLNPFDSLFGISKDAIQGGQMAPASASAAPVVNQTISIDISGAAGDTADLLSKIGEEIEQAALRATQVLQNKVLK
jgi:hypothetical protein